MSATSSPSCRRYGGARDLTAIMQFASRSLSQRFPLGAIWHPGDIAWSLRGHYDEGQEIHLWEQDGLVQAIAWFVGPGKLWLEATPTGEPWIPEIIGWAEQAILRDRIPGESAALSVRAFHGDLGRIQVLERLGLERGKPESVQFEFDLTGALPEVDLPAGFVVRDSVGIDPEERAASHRGAWSALAHIGIENARSTFSAAEYESLCASPVYRPDLDLLVVSADGALVSNCIGWADAPSLIGIFEPMGTHPDFRGRRLARALLAEGLRRLEASGHRRARIETAHFNASAIAAYSSLFQSFDQSSWWTKRLLNDT